MKHLLSTTALVLSLLCTSAAFAHDGEHGKGGPFEQALSQLPQADAAKFKDAMKQSHQANKGSMEKLHALHEQLHTILTADKFDKAAFLATSAKLQAEEDKHHAAMTAGFANAVSQLPQEERVTLANALHHEHPHHGEHGPHGDESHGDHNADDAK